MRVGKHHATTLAYSNAEGRLSSLPPCFKKSARKSRLSYATQTRKGRGRPRDGYLKEAGIPFACSCIPPTAGTDEWSVGASRWHSIPHAMSCSRSAIGRDERSVQGGRPAAGLPSMVVATAPSMDG
jgi:hypothetical protein